MTIPEFIQKYFPGDYTVAPDWPSIPADGEGTAFDSFSEADLLAFGEVLDKALASRVGGFFVPAFNGDEGYSDFRILNGEGDSVVCALVDALEAAPGVVSFNVDLQGYGGYVCGSYLPGAFLIWGLGSSFQSALTFLYVPARR
jgi:hypothetical protein